ncbi:DUF2057 family protein [Ferrimonas aestuarii]|uniref:DUF2057 domain-containing protein n=1 Tax=Ferrimonas aestuarii TaxID=2569539 RepID=A0A4U1BY69_9GAMM|nr:DUF2057 family protein [Ferrimonas aestuarii]TKB58695.1 DUF2057 domain-containing protein [Ferrimonas aestuarii]
MYKIVSALALLGLSSMASAQTLELPKGFTVHNVNGNVVTQQGNTVELTEGRQVVTVSYHNPYINHPQGDDHYYSKPIYVVFDAKDGIHYSIELDNHKGFEPYTKDLQFSVTSQGQSVEHKVFDRSGAIAAMLAG